VYVFSPRRRATSRLAAGFGYSPKKLGGPFQPEVQFGSVGKVAPTSDHVSQLRRTTADFEGPVPDEQILDHCDGNIALCDAHELAARSPIIYKSAVADLQIIARPAVSLGSARNDRRVFGSQPLLNQAIHDHRNPAAWKLKLIA
jgi:hypothetical protein